jgi:hypothetical protein
MLKSGKKKTKYSQVRLGKGRERVVVEIWNELELKYLFWLSSDQNFIDYTCINYVVRF